MTDARSIDSREGRHANPLDAAAIAPVLSLPPTQRISPLSTRMHLVRTELASAVPGVRHMTD